MFTYHDYVFIDILPSINAFSLSDRNEGEGKIVSLIEEWQQSGKLSILSYATLGLKPRTRMMLWLQTKEIECIQQFLNQLLHTELGKHLVISHTLLGMTRPSQYSRKKEGDAEEITEVVEEKKEEKKYLVVYPFTKTKEWYLFPFEKRKELMIGHMRIGGKFDAIEQVLLYGFGIDDPEFIVSYQMDSLFDFQTLVMELRSTEARLYTENDTPIFTCIHMPVKEVLKLL